MSAVRDYVRTVLVSFEFLIVLICICCAWLGPDLVAKMNALIPEESEPIKWISGAPSLALVWTMSIVRRIRFPEKDRKSLLQQWPEYWRLCAVLNVALGYAFIFAAAALFPWLLTTQIGSENRSLFFFGSLAGAIVVAASCYFAEMAINDEFGKSG